MATELVIISGKRSITTAIAREDIGAWEPYFVAQILGLR